MENSMQTKIAALHIERQAGRTYYWASRSDMGMLEEGDLVPVWKPKRLEVERIFEEVRRDEFPNRPSRMGAVFVAPELGGFARPRPGRDVYEVEVLPGARIFETDGEMLTEAVMDPAPTDDNTRWYARSYWEGGSAPFFPEVIVQGSVRILRRLYEGAEQVY